VLVSRQWQTVHIQFLAPPLNFALGRGYDADVRVQWAQVADFARPAPLCGPRVPTCGRAGIRDHANGGWRTRDMFERYNIVNDADQVPAIALREKARQAPKQPPQASSEGAERAELRIGKAN
jgi:hypothetical protein